MPEYTIEEDASTVAIEVKDVAGKKAELLQAFGECQAGQCSCPTDEYSKLASMDIEESDDSITLKLQAKSGERFDTSEIAACLHYTTAKVAAEDKGEQGREPQ